jgi:flagellar basal body-associated protein FliL
MKNYLSKIIIIVAAVVVIGGLYYVFVVQGGTLAISLPKPLQINTEQLAAQPTPEETGSVLGESEPYENPLKEIYVNPFAK